MRGIGKNTLEISHLWRHKGHYLGPIPPSTNRTDSSAEAAKIRVKRMSLSGIGRLHMCGGAVQPLKTRMITMTSLVNGLDIVVREGAASHDRHMSGSSAQKGPVCSGRRRSSLPCRTRTCSCVCERARARERECVCAHVRTQTPRSIWHGHKSVGGGVSGL